MKPRCVCTACGGSQHGWIGHLRRAEGPPEAVGALRESADQVWWEQSRRHRENGRRAPTQYLRQAGGGVAVAALVAWLADEERTRDRVRRLGNVLHSEVFDGGLRQYAAERAEEDPAFADYGSAMVGHFWCDLLTEIANVLDRGADQLDRVPAAAGEALFAEGDPPEWGRVRTELAKAALGFLWKCFQWFLNADPKALALQLRVLAVLICPDAGAHPRVARCCLLPLVKGTLSETVGANLEPDWLWGENTAK
ncbi:hypothetical protein KGD83_12315 [Nocardiopsis akebiae]|uniref:Uncharacterized protein n=2 Tax=Nocardiopsis akebiae TaxID=2831968 RepID=A0ABX8CEB4_9ACTN|nr:hypothetical protein KGD83_12315 [Nocardiopsis akebiae]